MLRQWKESGFEPFSEMNSGSEVMRYFLAPMTRRESLDTFTRISEEIAQRCWGVWVVGVDGIFVGMVGLHFPEWQLPFSPCVSVLWRLRKEVWGTVLLTRPPTERSTTDSRSLTLTRLSHSRRHRNLGPSV
jgi:RimJ/RimL family protein N-acetyltransferase